MSKGVRHMNPGTMAPPVGELISQISIAPAGRLAFVAGQVALDPTGKLVGTGDHAAQAEQCFRNLALALEALDAAPDQIVKMTIAVVDHHAGLVMPVFDAGRAVFGDRWPTTSSILLGVPALGLPEWLVEVDAIVALGA